MAIRYAKIILVLFLAIFASVAGVNNILDYNSNFHFVQHVLSMDTTFPDNKLAYRAITTPWVWHFAYCLIIALELLTAGSLALGAQSLWCARHSSGWAFGSAKRWAIVGLTLGFGLWFLGFLVIGGEWFLMWQSPHWNGQENAFKFCMTCVVALIFICQAEPRQS